MLNLSCHSNWRGHNTLCFWYRENAAQSGDDGWYKILQIHPRHLPDDGIGPHKISLPSILPVLFHQPREKTTSPVHHGLYQYRPVLLSYPAVLKIQQRPGPVQGWRHRCNRFELSRPDFCCHHPADHQTQREHNGLLVQHRWVRIMPGQRHPGKFPAS